VQRDEATGLSGFETCPQCGKCLFDWTTTEATTGATTTSLPCSDDSVGIDIQFAPGSYANEASWELGGSACTGKGNDKSLTKQCCLAPGTHKLKCKDSWGDGWNGGFLSIGGQSFCGTGSWKTKEEDVTVG